MSKNRAAILLALVSVAAFAALAPWRAPIAEARGDEGTFLAMAASLVHDGDLRFDERDRERLSGADAGRSTVILQRTERGIAYSKPILYPLAAAPFYALFGESGFWLLNLLALAAALVLGFAYLERLGPPGQAALVLATFAGASLLVPHLLWRMTDLAQASLALAGLALCFGGCRPAPSAVGTWRQRLLGWHGAPWLGALLLGLLVSMRLSNGALAAAPVLAALLGRRLGRAAALAVVALTGYLLAAGLTLALTGEPNPYRATRTSFNAEIGYPVGEGAAEARQRFAQRPATNRTGLRPAADGRRVPYAALYFFLGRHSSFVFYFPAGLVLLLAAARRPDRIGWALLISFAGAAIFFLAWRPWNYFGGGTFLGNRYLLPAYPALLLALRRLPGTRLLAVAWAIAAVAWGSAMLSAARTHTLDRTSQNHTHAGIFRLLPYESTAQVIDGRRDRYWADHFVRFVDPWARVRDDDFVLVAGEPAAELLVAHWQPAETLRLAVRTTGPGGVLELSDYGHRAAFDLLGAESPAGLTLELTPSRAWRRHRFWWDPETLYTARALRLRLVGPEGVRVRVRYLGVGDS